MRERDRGEGIPSFPGLSGRSARRRRNPPGPQGCKNLHPPGGGHGVAGPIPRGAVGREERRRPPPPYPPPSRASARRITQASPTRPPARPPAPTASHSPALYPIVV